eukprot:9933934-Alexandrium_andersonii.AAC.1
MQTVPRSELLAVVVALDRYKFPIQVHSDSAYVVQTSAKGEQACMLGENSDLWSEFWLAVSSRSSRYSIVKVKGHAQAIDLESGDVS